MAADETLVLRVCGRYQNQNIVNNLHYLINTQVDGEQEICQKLVDEWESSIKTAWKARHSDSYTLMGLKCFRVDGAAKMPGFAVIAEAGSVTSTVDLPAYTSRMITLYTDAANTRRRGRIYLSGTDNSMINEGDGAVTSTEQAALVTLADLLVSQLDDGSNKWDLCIPPTDVLDAEKIVAALPRPTPGILRSRRIRTFAIG